MNLKTNLLALGVICGIAILGSPAASAQSNEPKDETKQTKESKTNKDKIVTVKSGDTLTKIAERHDTTYVRLFNANKDIGHPDMIDVGDKIRVPKKDEKLTDRHAKLSQAVASYQVPAAAYRQATATTQSYTTQPVNSSSYYVGNGMWCTDYVAAKRPDISIYGNAGYNWVSAARAEGKSTGSTAKAGAVAVTNGHVAYVESVNADGSYTVSEMGWNYQAGKYNKRTVQPGSFGQFIY